MIRIRMQYSALICELQERLGEEYILEKHEKEEVNQEPGKRIIVHKKQEQVSMALHTKGLYEKFIGGDICMEEIVDDLLEVIQGDNNESGRNLAWEFRKLIMNMKSVHSHIYPSGIYINQIRPTILYIFGLIEL